MAIDTRELDELIQDLAALDRVIDQEATVTVKKSLSLFEAAVASHTPVNTGAARASITSEFSRSPMQWQGVVTSPLYYVEPLETGRGAGKPPPTSAIKLWVIRKGIASGEDADSTAFLIARSIGRKGTKGAFMFKKGFDEQLSNVLRLWDDFADKVVSKLL